MQQTSVRIPPVSAGAMTDEQKAIVGQWSSMNFAAVMVTHPELYKSLVPLIAKVISGSNLPPRDREVLVLRTLALSDEVYEAHHHALIARNADMTDAEIEQARTGKGAALSRFRSVARKGRGGAGARPMCQRSDLGGSSPQRYSSIELMEVVALVGVYTMMAMLTKTCGIQLEDPETFNNFAKIRQYK